MAKEKYSIDDINLDVEVVTHQLNEKEILEYAKFQRQQLKGGKSVTLNEYLHQTKYKDQKNIIVRANLSGIEFHRTQRGLVDLSGVDFTGSILNGVKFEGCNLQGAVFCETDLHDVYFSIDSVLENADFRGCDMSKCVFHERGINSGSVTNIKLSTTNALARRYGNMKGKIYLDQDRKEMITKQEALIKQKNKEISNLDYMFGTGAYPKWKQEKDALEEELNELQDKKIPLKKSHIMHHSYKHIVSNQADYDPSYIRGSTKAERDRPRELMEINREDVEEYLKYVSKQKDKKSKVKSLNEFTKEKFLKGKNREERQKLLDNNTKFIAICYARYDKGNLLPTSLAGLNFSNANLSGSVFAGADLRGCNFTNANISNASFEGANLGKTGGGKAVIFNNTKAQDAIFFDTNIADAKIKNSDFRRAFMPYSEAKNIKVTNTNLSYANIKHGKWDDATIEKSKLDYANMEAISLANANIREVSAQHAIFDQAVMDECKIIESNFRNAYMNTVSAKKAEIKQSIMEDIKAHQIDFKNAIINNVKLNGANLSEADITKLKAKNVNLQDAIMTKIEAGQAELNNVNLEGAKAQFANFKAAVLNKAKANNMDLTGANLEKLSALEANLTNACVMGANAEKAKFANSVLNGVDLRGANLTKADLTDAFMKKAQVNMATKLKGGKIKGVKGNLIEYDSEGKIVNQKKSIEEQKKQTEAIENVKNLSWYQRGIAGKMISGIAKFGAGTCNKIRETGRWISSMMEAKVGPKWGKVAGGVIGVAAGIALAAAIVGVAVLTGGLSVPVTIGIYVGCAAVLGGGGTVAGHYMGDKVGVGSVAAAGVISSVGIPIPMAVAGGVAADASIKQVTGKNISEHLNSAGAAAGVLAAVATGGTSLPMMLAGAAAGSLVDQAVEKMTGKSIAAHGDKLLENVSGKLTEIANQEEWKGEARVWVQEQNRCNELRNQKFDKLIETYNKQQSKYKEDMDKAKMQNQYIIRNAVPQIDQQGLSNKSKSNVIKREPKSMEQDSKSSDVKVKGDKEKTSEHQERLEARKKRSEPLRRNK